MKAAPRSTDPSLVFGKYQVIRRIAVGGMGEIFLARQAGVAGFDRLVILKSLRPELAAEETFITRFLDEARVVATLNHPNIVSVYDVGEWHGVYFMVMEYIRGANLGKLVQATLRRELTMPMSVPISIVHDAALGLDHAHYATSLDGTPLRIVHRDVSLANVMVRADGVAKVVDFGIARATNRESRTETGVLRGKLAYMSPEQAAKHLLDGRSDQFSLGVVLWELSTQRRLFEAEDEVALLHHIRGGHIRRPSTVVPDYPPELEAIVMRMLERDPKRRYPRCRDVAADLRRLMERPDGEDNQKRVAEFIDRALGDQISDIDNDLTPSNETPFASVIGLTGLKSDLTAPRRRTRPWIVAASALVLTASVLGAALVAGVVPLPSRFARGPSLDIRGPRGATVDVDGTIWPEPVPTLVTGVAPGEHVVRLHVAGHPPLRRQVVLGPDERSVIDEPPPAKGSVLDVRQPRGATVLIDGVRWPQPVPTVITGLVEGVHEVRLELPGGHVVARRFRLTTGTPILVQDAPPAEGMVIDIRDPEGAEVLVNGTRWREVVPTVLTGLSPGRHEVLLRQPDKPALRRVVNLEIGRPVMLSEPPVASGMVIDIRDPEGARVLVDGKAWPGLVPTVVTGLSPGVHEVRLELSGRPVRVKRVTLEVGKPVLLQSESALARPTLVLASKPAGATVSLGERALGKTPARLTTLEPEVEHALVISKTGYEPTTLTLSLAPGDQRQETVVLERVGAEPAPRVVVQTVVQREAAAQAGFLTLKTTPWVKVAIDGKPHGSTPIYKVELSPGPHTLHLVNEEFGIDTKRNVTIVSGKNSKLDFTLK